MAYCAWISWYEGNRTAFGRSTGDCGEEGLASRAFSIDDGGDDDVGVDGDLTGDMGMGVGEVANGAAVIGDDPAGVAAEGVRAGAFSAANTSTVVPAGWELTNGASKIKDPNPTIWRTSLLAPLPIWATMPHAQPDCDATDTLWSPAATG